MKTKGKVHVHVHVERVGWRGNRDGELCGRGR